MSAWEEFKDTGDEEDLVDALLALSDDEDEDEERNSNHG
jgi:hypothetical protein